MCFILDNQMGNLGLILLELRLKVTPHLTIRGDIFLYLLEIHYRDESGSLTKTRFAQRPVTGRLQTDVLHDTLS